MEVVNTIIALEVDGEDVSAKKNWFVKVRSHWNLSKVVVLEVDGRTYAVLAEELIMAVKNSENNKSY